MVTTIVSGVLCAIAAGLLPIEVLAELTSVGTLFAFVLVSIGVMVLRIKRPNATRRFKVPGGPYLVPLLGALRSGGLIFAAKPSTLYRLIGWMAIGWLIYAFYGRKHSRIRKHQKLDVMDSEASLLTQVEQVESIEMSQARILDGDEHLDKF